MNSPIDMLEQIVVGTPGQANRLLRLTTRLGRDTLVSERLDGWESVDQGGFRMELTALSVTVDLDLDQLLGAPVLLELLPDDSRTRLRPFHAHVTAIERVGSNAGLVRYQLTLEPWLALLKLRQDSYVYHDATVMDIVGEVFAHYASGVVAPAWRFELVDEAIYVKRSLTTQYQESDYAFITRLLAEEGLFYWFEHEGDPASPTLGLHTLVIADHNDAFRPGEARGIRFHRGDATEKRDSIQHWATTRRWQTGRVARASRDYRSRSLRPAGAEAQDASVWAVDNDTAGPYAWVSRAQGDYRARQHLDAQHVTSHQIQGRGQVRQLAPGRCFSLVGHATQDHEPLACLRVEHHARNNLSTEVESAVEQALGSLFADDDTTDGEFYNNNFVALPIACPYRPRTDEGHGLRRQPSASAHGAQSAIVTGDGAPIHTDRDHRVIVQSHWQRGSNAASQLEHPRQANAPASSASGTWARVLTPLAGANWGSNQLPRVGQEVWLNYLEGDIDRPIVTGSLYNGQGNANAPYNRQAGGPAKATGNAPAWFTGNGHAGVLSGIKTQALATSASGTSGYRQLRFDDTPKQGHAQLATTDYATKLTLGHHKHVSDNARDADLGYGIHLSTQAQGALRGGAGLLLSSAAGRMQLDAAPVLGVLNANSQLTRSLAEVARQQEASLPHEPAAEKLNAVSEQTALAKGLSATREGWPSSNGIGGGEGQAPGWNKPHLVIHGQDGLVSTTPFSHVWVSGKDTVSSAGQDINLTAQGQWTMAAGHGISLYVQGSATQRPVSATGIALHAASGQATVEAQQDAAHFTADQAVKIASTEASLTAQGKDHLLLTAGGGYIKIEGGNIEIGCPGHADFKGAMRELAGPAGKAPQKVHLSAARLKGCELKAAQSESRGSGMTELG